MADIYMCIASGALRSFQACKSCVLWPHGTSTAHTTTLGAQTRPPPPPHPAHNRLKQTKQIKAASTDTAAFFWHHEMRNTLPHAHISQADKLAFHPPPGGQRQPELNVCPLMNAQLV